MNQLLKCETIEDLHQLGASMGIPSAPAQYVRIEGNKITITTDDGALEAQEFRSALKEVKMRIGEFRLIKRTIAEFKRQRRAEYTEYTRQRGSMFRGGGTLGALIRVFTTASRDGKRAALARDLQPFENGQAIADGAIRALQSMELQIKSRL